MRSDLCRGQQTHFILNCNKMKRIQPSQELQLAPVINVTVGSTKRKDVGRGFSPPFSVIFFAEFLRHRERRHQFELDRVGSCQPLMSISVWKSETHTHTNLQMSDLRRANFTISVWWGRQGASSAQMELHLLLNSYRATCKQTDYQTIQKPAMGNGLYKENTDLCNPCVKAPDCGNAELPPERADHPGLRQGDHKRLL